MKINLKSAALSLGLLAPLALLGGCSADATTAEPAAVVEEVVAAEPVEPETQEVAEVAVVEEPVAEEGISQADAEAALQAQFEGGLEIIDRGSAVVDFNTPEWQEFWDALEASASAEDRELITNALNENTEAWTFDYEGESGGARFYIGKKTGLAWLHQFELGGARDGQTPDTFRFLGFINLPQDEVTRDQARELALAEFPGEIQDEFGDEGDVWTFFIEGEDGTTANVLVFKQGGEVMVMPQN